MGIKKSSIEYLKWNMDVANDMCSLCFIINNNIKLDCAKCGVQHMKDTYIKNPNSAKSRK